jgi:hypothetical protein
VVAGWVGTSATGPALVANTATVTGSAAPAQQLAQLLHVWWSWA